MRTVEIREIKISERMGLASIRNLSDPRSESVTMYARQRMISDGIEVVEFVEYGSEEMQAQARELLDSDFSAARTVYA